MGELQILKEKANSNIHDILDLLEVSYTDRYVYLNGPCPVHGGDKRDGWSWHLDRGVWQCYTNHCHDSHDCDIYGLVRAIKECTFKQAKEWLKLNIGATDTRQEVKEIMDQRSNREFVNQTKRHVVKARVYDKDCLKRLVYHDYLETRGYPREIIERYHAGIGRSANKYMSDRLIFPVINIDGEIVGFTGRTLLEDYEDRGIPKWKHSRDYQASNNLFNIHNAAEFIRNTGHVIIVEGPLDVLRLEQNGIHNSVALLGKILHNKQMTLLMGVPCDNIKFALDADTAGRSGAKKAVELAKSFFGVEIVDLPEGKDCGDLTKEEVERIFHDFTTKT
jgi:5S rRNA maturation endonuclease (ribonuclease M5)